MTSSRVRALLTRSTLLLLLLAVVIGAAGSIRASAQSFDGRWSSTFGELRLHQIGAYVVGDYADNGVMAGKIVNGRLEGQFTNGSRAGEFQFSRSGNTLTGSWNWVGASNTGSWRATRDGDPGSELTNFSREGNTHRVISNDRDHIDGTFSSQYGEIRLFSRDLLLVGDYAGRGILIGIWDGTSFVGRFTNGKRVGWFDFAFLSRNGDFRSGRWGWNDEDSGTPWTMTRQSRSTPTLVNFSTSKPATPNLTLRPTPRPIVPTVTLAQPSNPEYGAESGPCYTIDYAMPKSGKLVPLEYEVVDGYAIYEGDIILGRHSELQAVAGDRHECKNGVCTRGQALTRRTGASYLWPAGVIPYEIADDFTDEEEQEILDGIQRVMSVTDLILTERNGQADYVEFITHDEVCQSAVGRQEGRQVIRLQPRCSVGNIAHEILHTAGFWHEQSRPNRDDHVEVLEDNVQADKIGNFDKHDRDGEGLGTYDYGSIMHYGRTAFSKEGCSGDECITIRVLQTDEDGTPFAIGQRRRLSSGDIAGVQELYDELDCVYMRPSQLRVVDGGSSRPSAKRWYVTSGRSIPAAAPSRAEAQRVVDTIQRYDANQMCYVGRPNSSFQYLLSDGAMPSGLTSGEDCISFRRSALEVQKIRGTWRVVDTSRSSSMFSAPNAGEAYRIIDLIQQFGANRSCFVGRPNASLRYLRR
jgi:hypothetical protein